MPTDHSVLPPSSADKWMACTAWKDAVDGIPSSSSADAEEGTRVHALLETMLRLEVTPPEVTKEPEIIECLNMVYDYVDSYLKDNPGSTYYPEKKLFWGKAIGYPELKGTSDLVLVGPKELVIGDYKHGVHRVDPETSKQLRVYLTGLIDEFGPRESYKLVIFQPRCWRSPEPLVHEITPEEIRIFTEEMKNAATKNLEGTGERQVGKHCKWCKAAPTCRALAEYAFSGIYGNY